MAAHTVLCMEKIKGSAQEGRSRLAAWTERVVDRLFSRVDGASLAFFRIAFGITMLVETVRYWFKIEHKWLEPSYFFTFPGFEWVQPWPGDGMYIHFVVMGLAALLIAIGFLYRLAMPVFLVCFTYIFLLDQTNYLNHFYLVCLISLTLCFVPANRTWSVDALLWPRDDDGTTPAWGLWMVRFHVGLPYFFGGIAKLNPDWLRGEPLRIWLNYNTDFPIFGRFFNEEWMIYFASYSSLVFDLLVVPLLLWRRTRYFALTAAILFHLSNMKLFSIGIFPWMMLTATLIFFAPGWPRRVLAYFKSDETLTPLDQEASAGDKTDIARPLSRPRRLLLAALGIYVAVHLLLPFRHLLYPGDCSWTEEGHTFAWHMMLRSKNAKVRFELEADGVPRQRLGLARDFLSRRQYNEMSGRPDMIHRFALHLAEVARLGGMTNVKIYVQTKASLNGRRYQPLIDPNVDLASAPRSIFQSADYIVPLEEPFLPRGHPDRSRGPDVD